MSRFRASGSEEVRIKMNISRNGFRAVVMAGAVALSVVAVTTAGASATPWLWRKCAHVHTKYPHGVGRRYAHDRTSGTPVTNFYRSTRLYNVAMRYNRDLDADRDGIACEKH
jgi:hypothetical protein